MGEASLKNFIKHVFQINDEALAREDAHDVKEALDEVTKILKKSKEE